jgi:uncharacterized protein (TIGR02246 family)
MQWSVSLALALILTTAVASAQPVPAAPALDPAFRAILDNFNTAWDTRDAGRFVRDFAEDADFMQAFGRYRTGRADTEAFMRRFFSLQTGAFTSREVGVRVRLVGDDVAFLEQELEGVGVRNADGSEQPPRRGQMMLVLRKTAGGWRIQHYRYLDIHTTTIVK